MNGTWMWWLTRIVLWRYLTCSTTATSYFTRFWSWCLKVGVYYSVFRRSIPQHFWGICCNCSMMKRFYGLSMEFFFFSISAETGISSWSSYNIFFKFLRYTSSENTKYNNRIIIKELLSFVFNSHESARSALFNSGPNREQKAFLHTNYI